MKSFAKIDPIVVSHKPDVCHEISGGPGQGNGSNNPKDRYVPIPDFEPSRMESCVNDAPKLKRPETPPKPVPPPRKIPSVMEIQQLNPIPSTSTAPMDWGKIMEDYARENYESPIAKRRRQEQEMDAFKVTTADEVYGHSVKGMKPTFAVYKSDNLVCPAVLPSPVTTPFIRKSFFQEPRARVRTGSGNLNQTRDSSSSRSSRSTAIGLSGRNYQRTPSQSTSSTRSSSGSRRHKPAMRPHKDLTACLPKGKRNPDSTPISYRIPKEVSM